MKSFFRILFLCTICSCFSLMVSCDDGKIKITKKKWNYDFNSYPGLVKAKDGLLKNRPWNMELFDTILINIESNQRFGGIDYNEAFNILDGVLKGSANMVFISVDSVMKTPIYNNLNYWENLSSVIAGKTAEYQKLYGALESPNANLQTVDDMIRQYYSVLKLSQSNFFQTPSRITRYSGSYEPIENRIKSNKYWNKYFCHNTGIKNGISEFPQRLKNARNEYYREMMNKIIQRAKQENITKEQLGKAVVRYQSITTGSEQSFRDELATFLMQYSSDDSQVVSNNSFWR